MATALRLPPPVSINPDYGRRILTNRNECELMIPKDSSPNGSLKICKTMNELQQLYCQITKQGLSHNPSTVTKLITSCVGMGSPESLKHARKVFNFFKEDGGIANSLFMYNSLIRGYAFSGLCDEAFSLYIQMALEGVTPDNYTFPFVLSACTKMAAYGEGIQVHGVIFKMGLQEDVFIENSLIHFYSECGEVSYGRKVFDGMSMRNVVSYTSMICGYGRRDCPKEAVSLFFEMVEEGIRPNSVTVVCVVSACAKLRDLDTGNRVCAYIGESRLKLNSVVVNAVVDLYMKCGAIDAAKRLFDECRDRTLVLYNTFLSNYVHRGMAREAVAILDEMVRAGTRPDRVAMLSALSASAQLGDALFGKRCHCYVLRNGIEGSDSICNALIDMYMKCGEQEMARGVFDRMSNKTVVSWNSLIDGLTRNGNVDSAWGIFNEMPERSLVSWNIIIGALVQESMFQEAIQLFRAMQSEGIKADEVTIVSVASACGYLGALDLAKWIYTCIEKNDIRCDLKLGTALVDMFARCGDSQIAMQVFNGMKEKDVSAWTAAIGAMAMAGNGQQALEIFNEMLVQGVKPDGVVFVGVLTACSHGGLVEQGMHLFRTMKDKHGVSPQVEHYGCMVDLLGRAGLFREALDFIKTMPMEPNDVVWGSLLAACRTHKNVEVASYAVEMMTELAHNRTGIQVLLSNIYAAAGKWNDVAKLRLSMKERGVQKWPGSSSTEICGIVHEFTSGDESHPEMNHIALMLHEMNSKLKDAGHVPDLSNVLLDVDDQEKEYLLSRHSEKVAIAFGLINTAHGMPIRVVKNLRMCSDCHSFAKLVSKVYDREIIVRDNNRFHSFRLGFCSCSDYW